MNNRLTPLKNIAKKDSRIILGLMSGTSLDGLDIALCNIKGNGLNTKLSLIQHTTIPYQSNFKKDIKTIFSKENVSLQKLCLLNEEIGKTHARMINSCLKKWKISNKKVDLIASHGQTIYHAPKSLHQLKTYGNGTLQIGDGDHIAYNTGIITVSDFRQKHIAAGGEGAPLAAYGDYLLFRQKDKNTILLNIGGIANCTFIPAKANFSEIICTDIGPGNSLMDAWVQKKYKGKYFDKNAMIAKKGKVNSTLLKSLKSTNFFNLAFPKTTGAELFNIDYVLNAQQKSKTNNISSEDMLATLNLFTATIICESIRKIIKKTTRCEILISGGGINNPLLMENIKNYFTTNKVTTTAEKNIHPEAKEAILFAILANELIAGDNKTFGKGEKGMPNIGMGKISFPN